METMGKMELYSLDEMLDRHIGKRGTPQRDRMEQEAAEELEAWRTGEAIRAARQAQHLTQEELGARVGVNKSRISKLEKGRNLTYSTLQRVFKALGVTGYVEVAGMGKVPLW